MKNFIDRRGNIRSLMSPIPQMMTDRHKVPFDPRKLPHFSDQNNWSLSPTDGWHYNNGKYLARGAQDLADARRRLESIFPNPQGVGTTETTKVLPFFRLYHPNNKDHFYTIDPAEAIKADEKFAFNNEWIECFVLKQQIPASVPLFRLYKHKTRDHFYTTDRMERQKAERLGYKYEGRAGYVFPNQQPRTVPLFRLYRHDIRDHFYTTDRAERDRAVKKLAFKLEWIQAFVLASPDRKNHR